MAAIDVLKAHRLIVISAEDAPECSCGEWEPETATRDLEEHDEHVAAMLGGTTDRNAISEAIYWALNGSFGDFGTNHSDKAADAVLALMGGTA